jgi:hypothetical protein
VGSGGEWATLFNPISGNSWHIQQFNSLAKLGAVGDNVAAFTGEYNLRLIIDD